MGGASNKKGLKSSLRRIKDRYRAYRMNGYGPFSIFECITIELAKGILIPGKEQNSKIECNTDGKLPNCKTIWIVDHYSSEPKYGGIQRQFDFANELSNRGYRTIIVSSAFSHYTHSYISDEKCFISRFAENAYYAYVHTTPYKKNGGLGRVRNMFSFKAAVARNRKKIVNELGKPDVVVGASVHPLAWIAAYKIAKRYKIRFIAEVRDLWPEMWLLNGDRSRLDPMVVFFGSIEKWAYRKADRVIYSMLYGDRYICGKLGFPKEKVALIGQPMDCGRFDLNATEKKAEIPERILNFIGEDGKSFTCVFTGYYMNYEGVHVMLKAAKAFKESNIPIQFLFIGSGKEEEKMRKYVADNSLDNVLIHERINKELIPAILRMCNICLAHCATEGKEESFKYGISKNKVNEYLYSGNPVIYGRDDEEDPVAKYGAGFVVKPFREDQFVSRIRQIYEMSEQQRAQYGKNGQEYIIKYHRVDSLVDQLLEVYGI